MRTFSTLLFCCSIILILGRPGDAHQAGTGETCDAVEHNVAHTINQKNYSCDKTVCTACSSSGTTISGCTKTTYWENCVAAARGMPPQTLRPPIFGGVTREPIAPPKKGTSPAGAQSPTGQPQRQ
jgi:hypothetical protein